MRPGRCPQEVLRQYGHTLHRSGSLDEAVQLAISLSIQDEDDRQKVRGQARALSAAAEPARQRLQGSKALYYYTSSR